MHDFLRKIHVRLCFVFVFLIVLCQHISAQSTAIETTQEATYYRAIDFYARGEYILALPLFEQAYRQYYAEENLPFSANSRNCVFYFYDCLLRLDKDAAVDPAIHFIEREDPVIRKNQLSYLADKPKRLRSVWVFGSWDFSKWFGQSLDSTVPGYKSVSLSGD